MNQAIVTLATAGAAAAASYFLDPQLGRRRRALVRDQLVHLARVGQETVDITSRDVRNRAQGLTAELRRRHEAPPDDDILVERVRSQLGYAVRHPSSIEVSASGGRVTLRGPVLADEIDRLRRRALRVRGVLGIDDRLDVYDNPDGVPGLQGQVSPRWDAWEFEWMQRNWSPAARLVVTVGGAALLITALSRRGVLGAVLALPGGLALIRALANRELTRLAELPRLRAI
jgi:BON domain